MALGNVDLRVDVKLSLLLLLKIHFNLENIRRALKTNNILKQRSAVLDTEHLNLILVNWTNLRD